MSRTPESEKTLFKLGTGIPVYDTYDAAKEAVLHLKNGRVRKFRKQTNSVEEEEAYSQIMECIRKYELSKKQRVEVIRVVPGRPEDTHYVLAGGFFRGYIGLKTGKHGGIKRWVLYLVLTS